MPFIPPQYNIVRDSDRQVAFQLLSHSFCDMDDWQGKTTVYHACSMPRISKGMLRYEITCDQANGPAPVFPCSSNDHLIAWKVLTEKQYLAGTSYSRGLYYYFYLVIELLRNGALKSSNNKTILQERKGGKKVFFWGQHTTLIRRQGK